MDSFALIGSTAQSLINFRFDLLKRLKKDYAKVYACAPSFTDHELEKLRSIGVVACVFFLDRVGLNPYKDLRSILSMRSFLIKNNIDVVLLYTPKVVIYGSIASFFSNVKRVYSMITGLGYAFSIDNGRAFFAKLVQKSLYKASLRINKKVIFQNNDDMNYFCQQELVKTQKCELVNGSGVNMSFFYMTPLPENLSFVMVARIIKEKGVIEYMEAAKLVRKSYPEMSFYLVGDLDRGKGGFSENFISGLSNNQDVVYLGFSRDVRNIVGKSSVFVLPSYREGRPRAVLEAMAMGRAIITTDVPGCRETVISGKNGFLVPHKDHKSLAKAMLSFINNNNLAEEMGKESYEIARKIYDVNIINDEMMRIMER